MIMPEVGKTYTSGRGSSARHLTVLGIDPEDGQVWYRDGSRNRFTATNLGWESFGGVEVIPSKVLADFYASPKAKRIEHNPPPIPEVQPVYHISHIEGQEPTVTLVDEPQ